MPLRAAVISLNSNDQLIVVTETHSFWDRTLTFLIYISLTLQGVKCVDNAR